MCFFLFSYVLECFRCWLGVCFFFRFILVLLGLLGGGRPGRIEGSSIIGDDLAYILCHKKV